MQVWLYILFVSSFLAGSLGLAGHVWSQLPVPESLMITTGESVALVLSGAVMLALMLQRRQLPRVLGALVGLSGVLVGGYVLVQHLTQTQGALVLGFSRVSSLFCLGLGASLLLLCRSTKKATFTIDASAAMLGAFSVLSTFVLLVLASWGTHVDRVSSAKATADHHAVMLEREIQSSVGLIGRLAERWAVLDLAVPAALVDTELRRYFDDIPALVSIAAFRESGELIVSAGKTTSHDRWLTHQLTEPAVQRWAGSARERKLTHTWILPDAERPLLAMLLILTNGPSTGQFHAVFDIELMLDQDLHADTHDFMVSVAPEGSPGARSAHRLPLDTEISERVAFAIDNGPSLVVTAMGGPVSLFSLRGALMPATLAFGLLVSYLLVLGRSVATIQQQSSRELSVEEQRFRSLFFQSPNAVFEFSKDGRYLSLNAKARAITGIADEQLGILSYPELLTAETMSQADRSAFDAAFRKTIAGTAQTFCVGFLNNNGDRRDYECSFVPVQVDQEVVGLYAIVKDITERLVAEENQRLLTKSLESSDSAVLVFDVRKASMPAIFVNTAFTQMTGYDREEVLGSSFSTMTSAVEGAEDVERIRQTLQAGATKSLTVKSRRRDGTPFWNQLSLSPVRDEEGAVTHYTAIMKDISDEKAQEKRLAYQATHDVLTGLANRFLLEDRLEHDISLAQRNGEQLAVLFIDLDGFKPINDTLGHRVGDELLISVARRMEAVIRPSDTLARFGGDEFVLLMPDLDTAREAELVADRILSEIGQPHRVGEHEFYVTASIGISLLTDDLPSPSWLLQRADMAMYKAKQQGRDGYVVYSEDLDRIVSRRVTLRNELQEAIRDGQIFLNYQPQVDQAGKACGLEALVRWKHPDRGMISPAEFIPVAEDTGQIVHLGRWVMRQACRDAKRLLDMGLLQGRMAVNLSPLQFHRPGFLESIDDVLDQTGLPANRLELELTESILMQNSTAAIDILHALGRMGVTASIDDFGTGYSSFGYLKDLPVECVKIDKSFVDSALSDRRDAAVCKGVITMAGEMGIKVVAEGVESAEQCELLKRYGCDVFQGYYFARPMPFEDLVAWFKERPATTTSNSTEDLV